jgi:hypothetical protein
MRGKILTIVSLLLVIGAGLVLAHSYGPPDRFTGAPGEATCAACHPSSIPVEGGATITGPGHYSPGDTLDFLVSVEHVGQSRWGFELTVLNDSNEPVGEIIVEEPDRTQLSTDSETGSEYLKHNTVGTDPGVSDVSPGWNFKWASPPEGAGTVTFYAACNAANNDDWPTGDIIYTTMLSCDEEQVQVHKLSWGQIKHLSH